MRKSNWLVAAIAVVACAGLLALWFALGFNVIDSPLDAVMAILWWVVVGAVIAAIIWAEKRRRERLRLVFVGDDVIYNPERGLVRIRSGEDVLVVLQRTLATMAFSDELAKLDESIRPAFRWVVRSRRFAGNGDVWEGEVVAAHDPSAKARAFSSREDLAALLAA